MRLPRPFAALALVSMLVLAGCARSGGGAAAPGPGSMSAAAAHAFLAEHPEALLLDVRNPSEWNDDLGHVEGARLVPLPELAGRLDELSAWKDRPVITVCRVGARSRSAADLLTHAGFANVSNLEGGMAAWRRAGY